MGRASQDCRVRAYTGAGPFHVKRRGPCSAQATCPPRDPTTHLPGRLDFSSVRSSFELRVPTWCCWPQAGILDSFRDARVASVIT